MIYHVALLKSLLCRTLNSCCDALQAVLERDSRLPKCNALAVIHPALGEVILLRSPLCSRLFTLPCPFLHVLLCVAHSDGPFWHHGPSSICTSACICCHQAFIISSMASMDLVLVLCLGVYNSCCPLRSIPCRPWRRPWLCSSP